MSNDEIFLDSKAVGKLQEVVGGGSTVIANEPLSGDEDTLTELTVDGIKYAVPQGGGGIEYVEINPDGGTLEYDDYQKLINGAYIKFVQTQEAEFNGSEVICLPNHSVDELVYSSVVKDGKYYQVEFTVVDRIEFECTYTITEHSVGGGGDSGIFTVILTGNEEALTQDKTNEEICQALLNGKMCNAVYVYTYSEGGIELETIVYNQPITQVHKTYDDEGRIYTYNFYLPQETTGNYIVFDDTIQKFKIQGMM